MCKFDIFTFLREIKIRKNKTSWPMSTCILLFWKIYDVTTSVFPRGPDVMTRLGRVETCSNDLARDMLIGDGNGTSFCNSIFIQSHRWWNIQYIVKDSTRCGITPTIWTTSFHRCHTRNWCRHAHDSQIFQLVGNTRIDSHLLCDFVSCGEKSNVRSTTTL